MVVRHVGEPVRRRPRRPRSRRSRRRAGWRSCRPLVDHDARPCRRAIPAASRPSPSVTGRRPAATRRWLPSTRLPALAQRRTATPSGRGSTRAIDAPTAQLDPLAQERALDHRGHFGILPGEDPRRRLDDRDLRAEAPVGLGELDPDRAAADDEEPARPLGEVERPSRSSGHGTASRPGIGGIAGRDPVAITKRRARTTWPPAATVVGLR